MDGYRGVVLKTKVPGQSSTQFWLKERGVNHDTELFLLPNDSFTLLDTELNNKQLMKYIGYLKKLKLPLQGLEIISL
jgi:hypothetical protein